MFASNFTIKDTTLSYVRGEDKIKTFAMTKTIATGNTMTNYFCSVCGSLMYRGTLSSESGRRRSVLTFSSFFRLAWYADHAHWPG
jgi:hypothetical protein